MKTPEVEINPVKGPLFTLLMKTTRALAGKRLTRIPGISQLYQALYRTVVPGGVISLSCQGSVMYIDSDDQGLFPILMKGIHEGPGTNLWQQLVKPGMVVFDIGANVGYYTLMAARLTGGKGSIYSFEPVRANYKLLLRSIEANGYSNVTVIPRAISNQEGSVRLHLDRDNFGGHSLSGKNMPVTVNSVDVETTTLDHFVENEPGIDRVDLIKIDAQGAEGLIFEGAERTLRENDLGIMMEFWPFGLENVGTDPMELLERLGSFGFEINTIEDSGGLKRYRNLSEPIETCRRTADGRGDTLLFLHK